MELTESEKERVCICAELAGRSDVLDSEIIRVCNTHTAAVQHILAARVAEALRWTTSIEKRQGVQRRDGTYEDRDVPAIDWATRRQILARADEFAQEDETP